MPARTPARQRKAPSGSVAPGGDDLTERVLRAVARAPAVTRLRLVGSRAEGRANPLSDWDFVVETTRFRSAARALERSIRSLDPLGTFWDPLSPHYCFIALLPGPRKVDFLFDEPHTSEPPYVVGRRTLATMDVHFWDWTVWLAAKERSGKRTLVSQELGKMHGYLLGPLGAVSSPSSISEAVRSYLLARAQAEGRFGARVDRRLTHEALRWLADAGYALPRTGNRP